MSDKTQKKPKSKIQKPKPEKVKSTVKVKPTSMSKSLIIWLSIVFFISGTILVIGFNYFLNVGSDIKEKTGASLNIGGPYSAVDHNGQNVTEQKFLGKFQLIFFGYTYCPDICPTALTEMSAALDLLGNQADQIIPIFITIDPERDTPEYLKEYVTYFHPNTIGLSGSLEQITTIARAYRVYFAKAKQDNDTPDDYLLDHSSITYLMGKDGRYLAHFSLGTSAEEIARRIRNYL